MSDEFAQLEWHIFQQFGEEILKQPTTLDETRLISKTIEEMLLVPCSIWLSPDYFPLPGEDDPLQIVNENAPELVFQAFTTFKNEHTQPGTKIERENNVIVPLIAQDCLLGLIQIQSKDASALQATQLDYLARIAAQSALGIQINRQVILKNWRFQQLALVRSVGKQISTVMDLDDLSARVTQLIQQTFNYYHVAIFTQEETPDLLRFRSSYPLNNRLSSVPLVAKSVHKGMLEYVGKTNSSLLARDVTREDKYQYFDDLPETRSEFVLPLKIEDRLLGILDIQSKKLNDFHEIDCMALEALADQIAIAIDGILRYKDLKRNAEQMRVVYEVSHALNSILDFDKLLDEIIQLIHQRFQYPFVQIYTVSVTTQRIIYRKGNLPIENPGLLDNLAYDLNDSHGIIPWVAREGKTKLVNNTAREPLYHSRGLDYLGTQSELAIPLAFAGEILGVLDIQSNLPDAFDAEHNLALLESLAASISLAMRNARLFRSEQWRRMVADSFQDVATLLPRSVELHTLLDEILNKIEQVLPTEASAIWLLDSADVPDLRLAAAHCVDPSLVIQIHQESRSVREWLKKSMDTQGTTIRMPEDPFGPLGQALGLPQDYSSIAAPLYANEQPLGLITIAHPEPGRYGNEARAITATFANYASIAIKNAEYYAESQTNAWVATTLLQVAEACQNAESVDDLLEMLVRITPMLAGVNKAAVFLFDALFQGMTFKADYGINPILEKNLILLSEARVFTQMLGKSNAILIEDPNQAFAWFTDDLCSPDEDAFLIPLSTRQETHGALLITLNHAVNDSSHQNEFEKIIRIIEGITRHTATALDNLINLENRQQESYVTEVLLQVAQTVSSSNDTVEMLTNITYLVNLLVGIHTSQIFTWEREKRCFLPLLPSTSDDHSLMNDFRQQSFTHGSFRAFSQAMVMEEPLWLILPQNMAEIASILDTHGYPVNELNHHPESFNTPLLLVVPLVVKGELYGMLTAVDDGLSPRYREKRLEILTGVSQQIAIAMQNEKLRLEMIRSERIEQEFKLAKNIQQTFLPDHLPQLDHWSIQAIWNPAMEIGGDFYDVFHVDAKHLGLVIADVSDKGMGAALYMTVTRTLIRANAHGVLSPGKVLAKVNQQLLLDTQNGMFVTAVYIILNIETGEFEYANAGHNYPILYQPDCEQIVRLPKGNLALGVMEKIVYQDHHFITEPGDTLFLYTDGITENFSPDGEDFGEERYHSLIRQYNTGTLIDFMETIKKEIKAFHGDAPPSDDITLLAIQYIYKWKHKTQ